MVSRRTVILGGLGTAVLAASGVAVAIEDDVLPGRITLAHVLGNCDIDAVPPAGPSGVITSGRFTSAARQREVGWALALPPGHPTPAGLRVALVLHGRGGDHASGFTQLRLQNFLAAHVRSGGNPFALASVDGGDHVYWHKRAAGDDPVRMLTTELLPMLATLGLRTERVGLLGWSMGGYGALLLARESHRDALDGVTVAAAAAGSPALFASFGASAAGAFDDEADFAAHGMLATQPDIGTTPLSIACGVDDAFADQTRRYRANVSPTPSGGITKGCHTDGYWRSLAAEQIRFIGARLS